MRFGRRYWLGCVKVVALVALGLLFDGVITDGGRPGDVMGVLWLVEGALIVSVAAAGLALLAMLSRRGDRTVAVRLRGLD